MPPEQRWQMTGSGPEAYEHHLIPAIFAPWAAVLLELARLQPGDVCSMPRAARASLLGRQWRASARPGR